MLKIYFIFLLFVLFALHAHAQTSILERNISLEVRGESISEALKKIAQEGNFTFSYNPSSLEVNELVSFSANQKTVREILHIIFQNKVKYKEKGKYLILQKDGTAEESNEFFISGYVFDESTGKKIAQVSVYEPLTFASAVSNQYGYYQMKLPSKNNRLPTTQITIRAAKQHYQVRKVSLEAKKTQYFNIILAPEVSDTIPITTIYQQDSLAIRRANPDLPDSIIVEMVENNRKEKESLAKRLVTPFSRFFTSANQAINQLNIKDVLNKNWQIGLLPYLSSNQLAGNTEVKFSLNLLAGYNAGVKNLEIGGLVNLVNGNVGGLQAAGLMNWVAKTVKDGAQLGGLGNIVGGDVRYLQAGGLFNVNSGQMQGFQAAGLFNFNAKGQQGFQSAGLFNFNSASSLGIQAAGLMNIQRGNYGGAQISGLLNITSRELEGVQISGLVNIAKKVKKGIQVGVFNYADSAESIIPIGIFNYIRKGGYHRYELSFNDMAFTNFTFKTGVERFYTMLSVGMQPQQVTKRLWQFGYGIGSSFPLGKTTSVNLDMSAHHLSQDSFSQYLNLLNRASLSFEKRWKWIGIAAGPAWNLFITDITSPSYQTIFDNFPQSGFFQNETTDTGLRIRSWAGAQVAVRFIH